MLRIATIDGHKRMSTQELLQKISRSLEEGETDFHISASGQHDIGGPCWNGTGKRITIKDTRGIIDAILNGDIRKAPTKKIPYFNLEVPTELPGVDTNILDPRDTYAEASQWNEKAVDLARRFIKNFAKYEGNAAGRALVSAGPQV